MEMKFGLRAMQSQRLVMTPKLQQALKLLQVPTLELEQILKQEMMANPMLEEIEPIEEEDDAQNEDDRATEEKAEAEVDTERETKEEIDWDEYFNDGFTGSTFEQEHEDLDDRYERVAIAHESGVDKLTSQLHLSVGSDLEQRIGEYIIGSLNSDGFLTMSIEAIARVFESDEGTVEGVLTVIQGFDPPGIGARDLQDSLLLQLTAMGDDDSLARVIIADHFEALKNRKFGEIAKEMRISAHEVQELAKGIGQLDPRPGLSMFGDDAKYVVPDLIVEKVEGEYIVYLNDTNIPRLRVSRAYRDELSKSKQHGDKETSEFIVGKLNSARWLIQTIEQRRRTIVKVMQCIVEEQREFFDKGPVALHPLTLQQVANRIGMHESTVSRVTTNKYVQTPRGVFELKYFFSSSLDTDDGENMSSKAAKTRISEIIELENKGRPLSDQKIVDLLKDEGLNIARRTVAKYREQLSILPARMRKTY